jgi:hypothetical protein
MTTDPDCEVCAGTGRTFVDVAGPDGEHGTVDIDCPSCSDSDDIVEREAEEIVDDRWCAQEGAWSCDRSEL